MIFEHETLIILTLCKHTIVNISCQLVKEKNFTSKTTLSNCRQILNKIFQFCIYYKNIIKASQINRVICEDIFIIYLMIKIRVMILLFFQKHVHHRKDWMHAPFFHIHDGLLAILLPNDILYPQLFEKLLTKF